ncbi:MAG: hypothetical protein ACJ75J_07070 [Cytophagaceae bacterium]
MTILNSRFFHCIFISFICCFILHAEAQPVQTDTCRRNQKWGIGLRLQSANKISIKKYFGTNKGLELIAGRPGFYRNRHPNQSLSNPNYYYTDLHSHYRPWSLQLNFLNHKQSRLLPGLKWYYGFGAQFMVASFRDTYLYYDPSGQAQVQSKKYTEAGIGANAGLGLEYTFCSVPFSIFLDDFTYIEAFRHPLYMKNQVGFGLRYNL